MAPASRTDAITRVLGSGSALRWIVGLAIILRVAFVALVPFEQVYDNKLYLEFAARIASGQGYVIDGHPTAFWSAGYPFTLGAVFSLVGERAGVAIGINIAAAAVMVVLMARIAEKLSGDRAVANVAALLTAVFPGLIAVSAVTMTEQLYLTASLAGIWLLVCRVGWGAAVGAGVCFGYAALLRSQAVLFPAAVFGAMLLVRQFRLRGGREIGRLAVAMMLVGVVLTPWVMRNARVMGKATLSTNAGVLLAIGNNPVATGGYMHPEEFAASLGLPELAKTYDTMDEVEREKILGSAAASWMKANPAAMLKLWPRKLWITFRSGQGIVNWIRDGIGHERKTVRSAFEVFRYGTQAYYMVMWAGAALALAWSLVDVRRRGIGDLDAHAALLLAGVGYTAIMLVVFIGNARYGVPVYPFLCLSAATLAGRVWKVRSVGSAQ